MYRIALWVLFVISGLQAQKRAWGIEFSQRKELLYAEGKQVQIPSDYHVLQERTFSGNLNFVYKQRISPRSFLEASIGIMGFEISNFSVFFPGGEARGGSGDIALVNTLKYQLKLLEVCHRNIFGFVGGRFFYNFNEMRIDWLQELQDHGMPTAFITPADNRIIEYHKGVFPMLLLGIGRQYSLGKRFLLELNAFYQQGFLEIGRTTLNLPDGNTYVFNTYGNALGIGAALFWTK